MTTRPASAAPHAVVIGAGFGGLGAAVRLRAQGYRVTVLEANEQAGGRASVFKREGYTFDAGPTVITAPYLIEELFEAVGRDMNDYLELLPVDPFYRVAFHDGGSFDYVGDEERLLGEIGKISPRDVDGYRKYARHVKDVFDIGYTQLADAPFGRLADMLRVVPDMIKLESYRSVYGLADKYFKDERIKQVFSFQPLLVGGNPFNTSSIYTLIHWLERKWGVWFPRGGTGALVQALVNLLEDVDVPVRTHAPVGEIVIEAGKVTGVRLEDGEVVPCDLVCSNADPTITYQRLVDPKWRKRHTDRAVSRKRQSMSLFVGYFGTQRDDGKQYEDIAHHTIVLGPRYKGLLDDIFHKRVLADDYSLYLHRPTATDPALAPEGADAWYVLSPVPNHKSGLDWSELAEPYFEKILTGLEKWNLPGLKDAIVPETKFSFDPRTFSDRLRSADGAAFGLEPVLHQSAYFRYHNASEDVDGLYFVGASTHPGAGVPGVLCSAKVLERVVPTPSVAEPLPAKKTRKAA
jgi:phytoene desaturase